MSYKFKVEIDNKTGETLTVVEKTCWYYANGGIWTEDNVLEMGGSGTSGILRIKSSSGHIFSVVVGFHNYKPWIDAQVDLKADDTAVKLHPEYYNGGRLSGEADISVTRTTSAGRKVEVNIQELPDGPFFKAVITYS